MTSLITNPVLRSFSASSTEGEIRINQLLKNRFPEASNVQVNDISGGCGEMYEIKIETVDFIGVRTLKQHQMVTEALKDEVPKMHGLRIFTFTPKTS